jgi:signal transduction histidine kinase/ActR/RegA family two-component response regulator
MDLTPQFIEVARTREQQFVARTSIAGFIGAAAFFLQPSIWPVIWFAAVLVTQVADRMAISRLVLARKDPMPTSLVYGLIALAAFNSIVYVAISAYLWFCGSAGQVFAIMVICGALLHCSLHQNRLRPMLVASAAAQSLYFFGLPIASFVLGHEYSLTPIIIMYVSGGLFLAHLAVGAQLNFRTNRALREANALAEAQQRLAEAASQSKSDFLATISHEIRTPLNAVTTAARLLDRTALSAEQAEYVAILVDGAEVLLGLINEVLDISKIEAGKMTLEAADVDLTRAVAKLSNLWAPKAAERGLTLDIQLDPAVPRRVRTDGLRLNQILFNLVSNALKFTDKGGVRVMVREAAPAAAGARRLAFEVIDTGPGMSAEVQARLFRNFEQADAGVTRRYGGTGLGLAISRKLAELMEGSLTVESAPGAGSTFRLEIPLVPAAESETATEAQTAQAPAPGALAILVAEDHPVNRRVLTLLLEPTGWALTLVENGAEAVEATRARAFDLILMDMQMPIMSGLEAATLILRGDGPNARTPIIALTANAFDDQRAAWEAVGAAGYVTKPIDPATLMAAIAAAVEARETADDGAEIARAS